MATINMWAGASTQAGFAVKGRVDASPDALLVSLSSDMSNPISFPVSLSLPESGEGTFIVASATGLDPSTWYHYALSFDGTPDTNWVGRVKTTNRRGRPGNLSFAAWSCAGGTNSDHPYPEGESVDSLVPWSVDSSRPKASDHPAFESIENQGVDLLVCTGDLHYWDIPVNEPEWFHLAYDYNLEAPRQRSMWKSAGMVYTWDDHDYGPNNSDSTTPSRPAALKTYRQRVPSHEVVDDIDEAIYHSFVDGRVRVVVTDTRSERDPTGTTDGIMFAQGQEDWFIAQLAEAKRQGQVVCWVNTIPWIASNSPGSDHWGGYNTYRAHLLSRMEDTGILDQIYIVSGDMHALAIDDGRNNAWGGFPVFQFAAVDAPGSSKGGPYWKGPSQGRGRYGVITHVDDGETISVTGTGYIEDDEWDSYTHVFQLPSKVRGAASASLFPAVPTPKGWQTLHAKALAV